jgi:DNA invertase Pin-like site-specific DNA recombinase
MIVGYARTSTEEQKAGLEAQARELVGAGCGEVFVEQVSSVAKRVELEAALKFVRKGDVFMVTKPDRLARSTFDLLNIVRQLEAKDVALVILSMGGQPVDTRTATGKLLLTMLAGVAEFERALMLERQREGVAKAKAEGKYRGRKPTVAAQVAAMQRLKAEGVGTADIAKRLGVARSSVYRVLGEAA